MRANPEQMGLLDIPVVRFPEHWDFPMMHAWLATHGWAMDWWESDGPCVIGHLKKEGQ
jgi:hypothetical protein